MIDASASSIHSVSVRHKTRELPSKRGLPSGLSCPESKTILEAYTELPLAIDCRRVSDSPDPTRKTPFDRIAAMDAAWQYPEQERGQFKVLLCGTTAQTGSFRPEAGFIEASYRFSMNPVSFSLKGQKHDQCRVVCGADA